MAALVCMHFIHCRTVGCNNAAPQGSHQALGRPPKHSAWTHISNPQRSPVPPLNHTAWCRTSPTLSSPYSGAHLASVRASGVQARI